MKRFYYLLKKYDEFLTLLKNNYKFINKIIEKSHKKNTLLINSVIYSFYSQIPTEQTPFLEFEFHFIIFIIYIQMDEIKIDLCPI